MSDPELNGRRARAAGGDSGAVAELVELASERGDVEELRRLAATGSQDAADVLQELEDEVDPST